MSETGIRSSNGLAERPAEPASDMPRARILLVDDQPARLLTYEAILSGLGVQCVRALSGTEALQRLLEYEFAVILLDVHMPGMDGFEVARLVREHPRLERIPIIFITGVHVSELDQLKGYEVGAIDYIAVPVAPEILRSKVALLVELYQRRMELVSLNRSLHEARSQLETQHAQAIAERDLQLHALFEHPDQVTVVVRAERDETGAVKDWIYLDANRNALEGLHVERNEMLGRRLSEVLPRERAGKAAALCSKVLETREPIRYESQFAGKDLVVTIFPTTEDTVISSGVDITERKRIEVALRESEERLRETDRRKDEFLAMLAHELRNPIAPIRTAAEVLSRVLPRDEPARGLVAMIERQGTHLSRILDDLLDVARITQGRIELRREKLGVPTCVQLAMETVQPLIRARGQLLTYTQAAEPHYVQADKVRLEQCVTNLLTNAAKFSDPGSTIRIRSYPDGSDAVIEVTDNGIGISPDFQPRVFDLFAQSERSIDRTQGGLGIGLSICKQLVEMHGGRITCSSAGLGRGATFTIRLPRIDADAGASPDAENNASTQRVLIVDDNRDAADSLALSLQLQGYETCTVYSAYDALREVGRFKPQVALLDIGLPGMDGHEVARRIARLDTCVRMIAVSGYALEDDRERYAQSGFEMHLIKPVDMATLRSALRAPDNRAISN